MTSKCTFFIVTHIHYSYLTLVLGLSDTTVKRMGASWGMERLAGRLNLPLIK